MESSSSHPNGPRKQLTAEAQLVLREGIHLILSRWSALQLAVENEWAGRGSHLLAGQLASDIFSWFTQSTKAEPLYMDDLEDILDEGMLSLNAMVEDGSIEEVGEKLMIMHEECLEGNYSSIEKLRQAGPRTVAYQHIRQAADDGNDEDEDEDEDDSVGDDRSSMMEDAPIVQPKSNLANMPVNEPGPEGTKSEDGWVVVSSRRNKGKRN